VVFRHNNGRDAHVQAQRDGGAKVAVVEPGRILTAPHDPTFPLTPDGAIVTRKHGEQIFDISCHALRGTRLDEAAERKKNGFGELERRRTAKAQLDTLRARLEEPFHIPGHEAALRRQISTAENTFHNSFHTGYAGASAVRGSGFHAVALNEHFGYGSDAFDFLEAVLHEGDKLRIDEPGERFRHDDQTWACRSHREFTTQRAAVAMARGAYAGVVEADKNAAKARASLPAEELLRPAARVSWRPWARGRNGSSARPSSSSASHSASPTARPPASPPASPPAGPSRQALGFINCPALRTGAIMAN